MGYVRLVRSAGIRCVSRACVFLPTKADSAFPLADRAVALKLSDVTCEAAWNVKVNIANLSKDFVHKPDYFKVKPRCSLNATYNVSKSSPFCFVVFFASL